MASSKLLLLLPFISSFSLASASSSSSSSSGVYAVAYTSFGPIIGESVTNSTPGAIQGDAYFHIPYAEPPTGPLRWRPPVPWSQPWNISTRITPTQNVKIYNTNTNTNTNTIIDGALNATVNTHIDCADAGHGVEDCLILDVFTPLGASGSRYVVSDNALFNTSELGAGVESGAVALLPTLVWIHGGMHSGTMDEYDGRRLADETGAVVVCPNFRSGPLGYLSLPELLAESGTTGNYGLLDHVTILRWVHNNIRAFGGDNSRVVLVGESMGAQAVLALVLAEHNLTVTEDIDVDGKSKIVPLFHGAIAESPAYEPHPYDDSVNQSIDIARLHSCIEKAAAADDDADDDNDDDVDSTFDRVDLACLRALSVDDLARGAAPTAWGSVVDGSVTLGLPISQFEKGQFMHVPLIIGTNKDELGFRVFPAYPEPLIGVDAFNSALTEMQPDLTANATLYQKLISLYPLQEGDNRLVLIDLLTDRNFTCPARRMLRSASIFTPSSIYSYRFTGQPNCSSRDIGSMHGDEVQYWFLNSLDECPLPQSDQDLGRRMQHYWVNMASGQPNANTKSNTNLNTKLKTISINWPNFNRNKIDGEVDLYMALDPDNQHIYQGLSDVQCDWWDSFTFN